ncbi:hypothetical protein QD46_24505 [Paenibacillus polymyxa]|nr:hypothetical protein QD46_24505 [Paenibacillus polymyxa]
MHDLGDRFSKVEGIVGGQSPSQFVRIKLFRTPERRGLPVVWVTSNKWLSVRLLCWKSQTAMLFFPFLSHITA